MDLPRHHFLSLFFLVQEASLLLTQRGCLGEARTYRYTLGGIAVEGGMEVDELGLDKGDLGIASVAVNMHGLDIGANGLATGVLILNVAVL